MEMPFNHHGHVLSNALNYHPANLNRTYGVVFNTVDGDKKLEVHYELTVKSLTSPHDGYLLFEVEKKDIYIDHRMPDLMIDQLNAACGRVIYPLNVLTDKNGVFKGVNNIKAILERWTALKIDLLRYYTGNKAEQVIRSMDSALNNNRHFLQSLVRDQFMSLYFADVLAVYRKIGIDQFDISVPLMPYQLPLQYKIRQIFDDSTTDNGTVSFIRQGICVDSRSAEDIAAGRPVAMSAELMNMHTPLTGTLHLKYSIYKNDGTINSITGNVNVDFGDRKRQLNLQIYHLREKDPAADLIVPAAENKTVEQTNRKKRNGFFSFFN